MVNSDAVSPVVGVMLMLVVTIIIAAVVSALGGGLMEDTKKAPNAQIRYVGATWNYDNNAVMAPGMVFEHVGGDPLDLATLQLDLRLNSGTGAICLITYNDPPSKAPAQQVLNRVRKEVRMEKYGAGLTTAQRRSTQLNAGERFIIYSEGYPKPIMAFRADRNDNPNSGNAYSSGAFGMLDGSTKYILSDLNSGKILTQGYCTEEL